jgi:CTP synthase
MLLAIMKTEIDIRWMNAEQLEEPGTDMDEVMKDVDGILVPGGFGDRGIEGKIKSVQYAREHKIPFFGICLGLQCAVIEYARHKCGLEGANSSEFKPDGPYSVIDLMPDQVDVEELRVAPCVRTVSLQGLSRYPDFSGLWQGTFNLRASSSSL